MCLFSITYTIQMRRKPLFYVFNMIMPCFIITLISLLGFYIPSNSGEKVSMGITTLLSMTVFLMLVAENMPPTSDVLPLVGKKRDREFYAEILNISQINGQCQKQASLCHSYSRGAGKLAIQCEPKIQFSIQCGLYTFSRYVMTRPNFL